MNAPLAANDALRRAIFDLHTASHRQTATSYMRACELSWITMRRHVSNHLPSVTAVIIAACEIGLIDSPIRWQRHMRLSDRLSKSGDAQAMRLLNRRVSFFLADALDLLARLDARAVQV